MIPVRGFEDKTVAVFGLGRTGLTAARAFCVASPPDPSGAGRLTGARTTRVGETGG